MNLNYSDAINAIREIVREEIKFLKHYFGQVLSIDDPQGKGKIQVGIPRLGWNTQISSPWCFPRYRGNNIVPQVGDWVEVYFMLGKPYNPVYIGTVPEMKEVILDSYADPKTQIIHQDTESGRHILYDKENDIYEIGDSASESFVLGDELKTQLQKNIDALTQLQTDFTSWTPVPNDGGAALKTILGTGFLTESLASLTNILSELIKGE